MKFTKEHLKLLDYSPESCLLGILNEDLCAHGVRWELEDLIKEEYSSNPEEPPKREYELWVQAYTSGSVHYEETSIGVYKAPSLRKAVVVYKNSLPKHFSMDHIDIENLTYCGLKIFDNREQARTTVAFF